MEIPLQPQTQKPILQSLPRSVQWMVYLALLRYDDDADKNRGGSADDNCTVDNSLISSSRKHQSDLLDTIESNNKDKISQHRQRYDILLDKHYKNSSAIEIIHDTEQHATEDAALTNREGRNGGALGRKAHKDIPNTSNLRRRAKNASAHTPTGASTVHAPSSSIEDPLSVFAQIEEIKVKSEKEKEKELKKERALASRTQHSVAQYHDIKKKMNSSPQKQADNKHGDEKAGHRWSEFYSSREIMDIIEKDVDRLPVDHQVVAFHKKANKSRTFTFDLDVELKHMNDSLEADNNHDEIMKDCRKNRSNVITQILFVYAKEYPILGYRQGMHEILSLIFLCLEIDLLTGGDSQQPKKEKGSNAASIHLLDSLKIANDAFVIFEAIMELLSPAFEVRDIHASKSSSSSSTPMEKIGIATIEKIRILAGDEELYQFISTLSVPPELYCTRWIRLMFSREVKTLGNAMLLWDSFFYLVASTPPIIKDENKEDSTNSLMNILQITAASMIMMLRLELIPPKQMNFMGMQEDEDDDPNDCIHLLMNYPPIEDASQLTKIVEDMISGKINQPSNPIPQNNAINANVHMHMNMHQAAVQHQHSTTMAPYPHVDNTYGQQNAFPPPIDHNQGQHYGYPTGENADHLAYVPNNDPQYFPDTRYHNAPENQMYSTNHMQHNQYMNAQNNGDPLRSTIENIAGKDTWKKLSGGLSEGLSAVKGALGSIDYTISHLSIGTNGNSSATPYSSNSTNNYTQDSNVYNPTSRRNMNRVPGQSFEGIGNAASNVSIPIQGHQNQYSGEQSVYNTGYRDFNNNIDQNFQPIGMVENQNQNQNQFMAQTDMINNSSHHDPHQNLNPNSTQVDNSMNTENQFVENTEENIIVSVEDDFVGNKHSIVDESKQLADRLDSSLLKLSAYLQNEMMQVKTTRQQIPQSVWDAVAEIEAVKNDLSSIYKVSRK